MHLIGQAHSITADRNRLEARQEILSQYKDLEIMSRRHSPAENFASPRNLSVPRKDHVEKYPSQYVLGENIGGLL